MARRYWLAVGAIAVAIAAVVLYGGLKSPTSADGRAMILPVDADPLMVETGHGERSFSIEIADDPGERERGLMFRDEMAAGHGMIFVHDSEETQSYWMKNTKIPLDIIYFDHARKLVSVAHAPPCSLGDGCPPFPSDGPALYVLELNGGAAEEMGLKAGDELKFGPGIPVRK